jgi:hypothetical protein
MYSAGVVAVNSKVVELTPMLCLNVEQSYNKKVEK